MLDGRLLAGRLRAEPLRPGVRRTVPLRTRVRGGPGLSLIALRLARPLPLGRPAAFPTFAAGAAERKDVLSAFFWMLTLWAYVSYVRRPDAPRRLIVLLCFVLGLMAKPMLVTLPFVLLLLDYWPLERFMPAPRDKKKGTSKHAVTEQPAPHKWALIRPDFGLAAVCFQ